MQECLEADGHLIPERQRVVAEQIIYDYVSFDDEENAAMHEGLPVSGEPSGYTMDELYHFTLQQEILNEQAANLIGELISIKLSGGFEGELGVVYERLLKQLALLKPAINRKESHDDIKLAEIRGTLDSAVQMLAWRRELVA